MPVPSTVTDLSVTAASNSPAGADIATINTGPDEYIRALAAIIRREQAQGANVASAATVDLGAIADGNYVHITGTTTITAFGTVAAGIERTVVFDGALTLTHNATSLILPGGANITTAAGDVAVVRSEGSGNWKCTSYVKASGAPVGSYQPLDALLTALAAQTTAANNVQAYSGADTPTLLSTGTASGNIPLVGTKSGSETLAGLVELATQAEAEAGTDDTVVMTPLKTAQAIAARYANSTTGTGGIASAGASLTVNAHTMPLDNTIPQNTEGSPVLNVTISCAVGDIIEVDAYIVGSANAGLTAIVAIFVDSVADAISASSTTIVSAGQSEILICKATYTATATSHTFKVRADSNTGSFIINTSNSTATLGGSCVSRVTAKVVG